MNRTKQVNEMFDLLQRECHKTLNNAKNSKKGGFSEEIEENYNLYCKKFRSLLRLWMRKITFTPSQKLLMWLIFVLP